MVAILLLPGLLCSACADPTSGNLGLGSGQIVEVGRIEEDATPGGTHYLRLRESEADGGSLVTYLVGPDTSFSIEGQYLDVSEAIRILEESVVVGDYLRVMVVFDIVEDDYVAHEVRTPP